MRTEVDLSKEALLRVVDAVRAMAEASAIGDYAQTISAALHTALRVTESDSASIYRFDESSRELVRVAAEPHHPGVQAMFGRVRVDETTWAGRNLPTLRPTTAAVASLSPKARETLGAAGFVHIATVPLHVRGRPRGSLHLARHTDRPFTEQDLRLCEVLAEVFVVHLENARLFVEASSRLDETRMLLEVARTVTASLSLDERLEASADVLVRMIDASNAFILLLEEEGTVLHGVASAQVEWRDFVRTIRIPVTAASLAARAIRTQKAVMVEDAIGSHDVRQELVQRFGEKSIIALPLLAHGAPIGVVVIDDTRRARTWSATEIERAELIVTQVANAVAHARLFETVKESYRQLAQAQEQLVEREKLAALGQLSATLAHEVRNPLGVLYNSIGTLAKLLPSTGDAAVLLSIMAEESRRLDRLVRELLEFAGPMTPVLERHVLADVIDGAVHAARQQLGPEAAAISAEVPDDFPPVDLDHAMMRRALVNLLVNGSQAAGTAGSVAIRAFVESQDGRRVARIELTDTGPGIVPEVAVRVFEPFFTTKATGTGLGLAIVKSIVDAHRGRIELSSDGERGTRATLVLPLDGTRSSCTRT